jgi:lipopolysaccharide/colanic/teichoic acid biosynthesis glycosyltransferase
MTSLNDPRITPLGKFLRKYNFDELPQLFNVLIGDMSFVGPRPDVKGYADKLIGDDRIILSVKPGITGPATLKFKNEDRLLSQQKDPKKYNDTVIWKEKVKINKLYVENWSLLGDLNYIVKTIFA